jgi:hypothetical protein
MKKTIAALTLIAAIIAPAVSMAAQNDYQNYAHTYPVSQGQAGQVHTAE